MGPGFPNRETPSCATVNLIIGSLGQKKITMYCPPPPPRVQRRKYRPPGQGHVKQNQGAPGKMCRHFQKCGLHPCISHSTIRRRDLDCGEIARWLTTIHTSDWIFITNSPYVQAIAANEHLGFFPTPLHASVFLEGLGTSPGCQAFKLHLLRSRSASRNSQLVKINRVQKAPRRRSSTFIFSLEKELGLVRTSCASNNTQPRPCGWLTASGA